ncbi:MAG: DUF1616 domain-containing protein [Candidatus Bathyarchaeota archaeon]|nr:DUF1616 domain-containing protein [Candidatus Bathyarchaeota archaeon]
MTPPEKILEIIEAQHQMTVGDLVTRYSESQGIPLDEATKHIFRAWTQEEIRLEPVPRRNLVQYIRSIHGVRLWAVAALFSLTLATNFILPQGPPFIYLRYLTGVLSVIFLPGAALVDFLYPHGDDLEPIQRLIYSIGLSLALTTLVGFVLHYTPEGIRASTAILSLALITTGITLLTIRRNYRAGKTA